MKKLLLFCGLLVAAAWVAGFATAKYQSARRERLFHGGIPLQHLVEGMRNVPVPENCALSAKVVGAQGWASTDGPTLVKVNAVEVTNRSAADLVFYRVSWMFREIGGSSQAGSMTLPLDIDSIVKPGMSYSVDTSYAGAKSDIGFESAWVRISSASFSDGTNCESSAPDE